MYKNKQPIGIFLSTHALYLGGLFAIEYYGKKNQTI